MTARDDINIGLTANTVDADTLRDSFDIINSNFDIQFDHDTAWQVWSTTSATGDDSGNFNSLSVSHLPDSGVTAATYGSVTQVPILDINAKGIVTSATVSTIQQNWELITTTSITTAVATAAVSWTGGVYNKIKIYFDNIIPETANTYLGMTASTDGVSYASGTQDYAGAAYFINTANTGGGVGNNPAGPAFYFSVNATMAATASLGGLSAELLISNPDDTTHNKHIIGQSIFTDYDNQYYTIATFYSWSLHLTTVITAIKLAFNSGNIASGTIKVYGLRG